MKNTLPSFHTAHSEELNTFEKNLLLVMGVALTGMYLAKTTAPETSEQFAIMGVISWAMFIGEYANQSEHLKQIFQNIYKFFFNK